MITDKQILKYLSGLMSGEEAAHFQSRISASNSLGKRIYEIEGRLNQLTEIKQPEIDEKYFVNLRVKVKERLSAATNKKNYFPKFAISLAVTVILIFAISKDFSDANQNTITPAQISWDEYFSILDDDYLPNDVNVIESYDEFSVEEKINFVSSQNQHSDQDIINLIPELDDETISELVNKKIL